MILMFWKAKEEKTFLTFVMQTQCARFNSTNVHVVESAAEDQF